MLNLRSNTFDFEKLWNTAGNSSKIVKSSLKYDSDVVVKALEKAQETLQYAKGDCRNTRAIDYLNDCIDGMDTWIANAKPRNVQSSRKHIKSSYSENELADFLNEFLDLPTDKQEAVYAEVGASNFDEFVDLFYNDFNGVMIDQCKSILENS